MIRRLQPIVVACGMSALLFAGLADSQGCPLCDGLFGQSRTTYSAPYTPAPVYAAPACVAAPACGACAQCAQPACGTTYVPQTAYYRPFLFPARTITYMPVATVDPYSGYTVTRYARTQAWTYPGSLVPYSTYRVAYSTPWVAGYSSCSSCGGYAGCSSCGTSYGGCSSCGVASGCSSCGVSSGCDSGCSSGCSSCGVSSGCDSGCAASVVTPSSPAVIRSPEPAPAPTTIAPPVLPPAGAGSPSDNGKTFAPGAAPTPATPSIPTPAPTGDRYNDRFTPKTTEGGPAALPRATIEGVPPMEGPRLLPTPVKPDAENHTASRPVHQAMYFQLIPSPPKVTPVYHATTATPVAAGADDDGWRPSHD